MRVMASREKAMSLTLGLNLIDDCDTEMEHTIQMIT